MRHRDAARHLDGEGKQHRLDRAHQKHRHEAAERGDHGVGAVHDQALVERLEDERHDQGTHPEAQRDEVRGEAGAVVVNGRVLLLLERDGLGHHGGLIVRALRRVGDLLDAVTQAGGELGGAVLRRDEAVGQLARAVVQLGQAILEGARAVTRGSDAAGQRLGAVKQLVEAVAQRRSARRELAHAVVELARAGDAGGEAVGELAQALVERDRALGRGAQAFVEGGGAIVGARHARGQRAGTALGGRQARVKRARAAAQRAEAGVQLLRAGAGGGDAGSEAVCPALDLRDALREGCGAVVGGGDARGHLRGTLGERHGAVIELAARGDGGDRLVDARGDRARAARELRDGRGDARHAVGDAAQGVRRGVGVLACRAGGREQRGHLVGTHHERAVLAVVGRREDRVGRGGIARRRVCGGLRGAHRGGELRDAAVKL